MRNWLFSFFQRGSFVSNDERYFIEPANDGKMNTSAHFRKFHLLFRQATVREGFSNAPSTCGLVGKLTLKIRPACLAKLAKPMFCFCCYRHISRIQEAYLFWRNPIFLIYINDRHDNALLHVVLNHAPYQMGFLTPGSISAKTNKYHLNLGLITWQRKNHKLFKLRAAFRVETRSWIISVTPWVHKTAIEGKHEWLEWNSFTYHPAKRFVDPRYTSTLCVPARERRRNVPDIDPLIATPSRCAREKSSSEKFMTQTW